MAGDTDASRRFQVLVEEYKLHGEELLIQIQLYHKQTQYIQLYAAFFASLIGVITAFKVPPGQTPNVQSVPKNVLDQISGSVPWEVTLTLLALGALVAFYLVSAVFSSSYIILILRRRMAAIEEQINKLLKPPGVMEYERSITRRFLEQSYYVDGRVAPHLLSGILRVLILAAVTFLLVYLGGRLLPPKTAFFYVWTVLFVGFFIVLEYARLQTRRGREDIDRAIYQVQTGALESRSILHYPVTFLLSYAALVGLLYLYTHTGVVNNWLSSASSVPVLSELDEVGWPKRFLVISTYTFLAGTVAPILPSEAPILLFGQMSPFGVLLASAVGKGIGATLIVLALTTLGSKVSSLVQRLMPKVHEWLQRRLRHFVASASRLVPGVQSDRTRWRTYFLLQAIPFAPMRSSTIALGALVKPRTSLKVGAICAVATVIRMLFMLGLLTSLGSITRFLIPALP